MRGESNCEDGHCLQEWQALCQNVHGQLNVQHWLGPLHNLHKENLHHMLSYFQSKSPYSGVHQGSHDLFCHAQLERTAVESQVEPPMIASCLRNLQGRRGSAIEWPLKNGRWKEREFGLCTFTATAGAPMLMVLGSTVDPTAGAARGASVAWAPTVVPGRTTAEAPRVPWSPIFTGAQAMLVLSTAMLVAILQVSPFTTLQKPLHHQNSCVLANWGVSYAERKKSRECSSENETGGMGALISEFEGFFA